MCWCLLSFDVWEHWTECAATSSGHDPIFNMVLCESLHTAVKIYSICSRKVGMSLVSHSLTLITVISMSMVQLYVPSKRYLNDMFVVVVVH